MGRGGSAEVHSDSVWMRGEGDVPPQHFAPSPPSHYLYLFSTSSGGWGIPYRPIHAAHLRTSWLVVFKKIEGYPPPFFLLQSKKRTALRRHQRHPADRTAEAARAMEYTACQVGIKSSVSRGESKIIFASGRQCHLCTDDSSQSVPDALPNVPFAPILLKNSSVESEEKR